MGHGGERIDAICRFTPKYSEWFVQLRILVQWHDRDPSDFSCRIWMEMMQIVLDCGIVNLDSENLSTNSWYGERLDVMEERVGRTHHMML